MKWTSFIHLKEITKLLTKKRINNCNHQPSQHSKERMNMTTTILFTKRRTKLNYGNDNNILQNRKL